MKTAKIQNILIFAILLISSVFPAQKILYFGSHENTFVTALEVDSLGRLWVATEAGVVVYDGQSFHHPGRYELINNVYVRAMKVLNKDSLLLSGGDQIYLVQKLISSPVVKDDFLWSRKGHFADIEFLSNRIVLNNYNDSSLYIVSKNLDLIKKIKLEYFPASIATWKDILVVGTDSSRIHIYRFSEDSLIHLKHIDYYQGTNLSTYSLLVKKKEIFVGPLNGGIYHISDFMDEKPGINLIEGTEGKALYDFHEDPLNPGYYWAGSQYFGIFYFNHEKVLANKEYSKELTNSLVWAIYPDRHGHIFAGTQYGITIFKNTSIIKKYPSELGAGEFIWAIEKIERDLYWLATSKGVVGLKKKQNSFEIVPIPWLNRFSDQSIFKILNHAHKQYLIISGFPYFVEVNGQQISEFDFLNLTDGFSVTDVEIFPDNTFWLASSKIIFGNLQTKSVSTLSLPGGKNLQAYAIERLPDGTVVYGTIEGLFLTDGKSVWEILPDDSISLNITQLLFDPLRKKLLVGATARGLYEYDLVSKRFTLSQWDQYIAGKDIYAIKQYGDSLYIFGTELGVSIYNLRRNEWHYLNTSNGLSNNEINSYSILLDDGYLFIGTGNGLNIIPISQIKYDYQRPKIYISYIKPTPTDHKLVLPFRNNFLEINIGILSFAADPLFKTVYKIEGLDTNWMPLETSTIYLRNLPPGDYVFKAKTYWRDPLFTSETISMPFSVHRPFWYSVYGMLLGVLVLGLLIFGYAQYRTFRLEKISNRLRKELEKEQERSLELENIFSQIFKHSSIGILFIKKNGEIESSNGSALELISIKDIENQDNIYDLTIFKTNRQLIEAIQQIKLGKVDKCTVDINIENIENKNLRFYFWKLKYRREEHIGILISDLSSLIKQKSMEVQIQAYNQVLATLAHYLNNTMTILGLAEENYRLNPDQKHERLADIAKMSVKKVKFILDLLDKTINSRNLKFRDYADAKNLLIDIEEEIKKFNEQNAS